jgi:hypothetical protein
MLHLMHTRDQTRELRPVPPGHTVHPAQIWSSVGAKDTHTNYEHLLRWLRPPGLQDSHERWTVPTIMCDCRRVGRNDQCDWALG